MLGDFGGDLRARRLLGRRWSHCGIRILGPLTPSERQAEYVRHVPSYCGRTSALCRRLGGRTSIRRSLVSKELRCSRREEVTAEAERRRGEERDGTTDTGSLVIRRARAGLSKSGQESHRACARCRHSGHDVRVNTRNRVLATPSSACHAVRAPSFSSWTSFQFRRLTATRKPTRQALTQPCGRDRAMTASASAVTLRGIPQCHGEHVEPTA
ncbi:putative thimet oligopeptidase, putative,metallo-peptidase, clan MA(E), family M3 [Trypanosoma cruzi]|nr:putative thimet oligopeptidase, putative,metallo-peptidase, clan MA(E), family M3 [Trypanosoma cruzi]